MPGHTPGRSSGVKPGNRPDTTAERDSAATRTPMTRDRSSQGDCTLHGTRPQERNPIRARQLQNVLKRHERQNLDLDAFEHFRKKSDLLDANGDYENWREMPKPGIWMRKKTHIDHFTGSRTRPRRAMP